MLNNKNQFVFRHLTGDYLPFNLMVDQPALVHQLRSLYPYLAFDFYDGLFYNVIMNDKESKRIYDANLTPEMRERKRERNRINKKSPYGKFKSQKDMAKKRGVEWQLTFDEWYTWWQESGHWEERGRGANGYVMARIGDGGPYALNNIKCITQSENASEYFDKD